MLVVNTSQVMEVPHDELMTSLRWGVCLPTYCSDEIVRNNSKLIFNNFTNELFKDFATLDVLNVNGVSCMEKMGPSKGYYAVLSILVLLLLWSFISSLVVLRYKTRSRMRYSFVYRSGQRSLGVVEPHLAVLDREGPSAALSTEGRDNLAAEEDDDGIRPSLGRDTGDRESGMPVGVRGSDVVTEDDGVQKCHEGVKECRQHEAEIGKRRGISEPPVSSTEGGGQTSFETLPADAPAEAGEETFPPPSHELLRDAFRYRPGIWTEICYIFSLERNLSNLAKERPNNVIGLDCLRVLAFWLLLLVQVYLFAMEFGIIVNASLNRERINHLVMTHIIACYPLALDALFFVSGFASMLNYKKRKWNSLVYIIRRYLRLFVPLAAVLLVAIYLLPYWTSYSAPQSFKFEQMSDRCSEHWWKVVLGIQNFMVPWEAEGISGCLHWTWVVASQWQQSILLSLVFLCILNKIVIFFHVFLLVACLSSVASLIDILRLDPNVVGYIGSPKASQQLNSYMNNILTKPYTFVAPFAIGVIASYKLLGDKSRPTHNNNNNNNIGRRMYATFCRRFNKKNCCWLGWCYCVLVLVAFFALNCTVLSTGAFSVSGKVFSGTSFHLFWPLALYWIVYSCCRGDGGFFKWFASWKVWMYMGRLTYSAYLVHGLALMYVCSAWTSVVQPEDQSSVLFIFSSALVVCYSSSLVIHLLVEAPLLKLLSHSPDE